MVASILGAGMTSCKYSYNRFGLGVTARLARKIADGMKKYQLDEAGYKHPVIDDGWQSKPSGPKGELLCNPGKFPDGIAPSLGLASGSRVRVRDLWVHKDIGDCRKTLQHQSPPTT